MEKQRLISSFNKNSVELIKIHIGQNDKKESWVDVRIWYLPEAGRPGSEIATKRGIHITSSDLLPKLIEGLKQAQEEITKIEQVKNGIPENSVEGERRALRDAQGFFKKAGNGIPENSEKAKGQEK